MFSIKKLAIPNAECRLRLPAVGREFGIYPVRNNAPLLPPGQRPSGPAAAAGLDFRIIPAGFNAPLEFLTGFTLSIRSRINIDIKLDYAL